MIYDILNDSGEVINTIVADEAFVQAQYPGRYRFVADEREPLQLQIPLPPVITKVAMISRFTPQEYVGVVGATKTDVEVQAWYDLFQAANVVDLSDQRTIAGINSFVGKNLLTQARADAILTDPVQDSERP
jgi:hypothetical protein